jgi:hypothetical protein
MRLPQWESRIYRSPAMAATLLVLQFDDGRENGTTT